YLVEHMVAAQEEQVRLLIAGHYHERFDDRLCSSCEDCAYVLDAMDARSRHLAHALRRCLARLNRRNGLSQFDIGGVVGGWRKGDCVLTRIGQHVEFVRTGSANGPGVGRHRPELQPESDEDTRVS